MGVAAKTPVAHHPTCFPPAEDGQFEELEPDDFVNERSAPAPDKQQEQEREEPTGRHEATFARIKKGKADATTRGI